MSEYSIGAQELGETQRSDFGEFINIVSGRSVVSGADWGNDRFELGFSGEGMIRVFWTPEGLHVNFISTTNASEIPPLILQLVDEERRLPARGKRMGTLSIFTVLYRSIHVLIVDHAKKIKNRCTRCTASHHCPGN